MSCMQVPTRDFARLGEDEGSGLRVGCRRCALRVSRARSSQ